jgi:transposase InsO family protein
LHNEFGDSYSRPSYNSFAKWIKEDIDPITKIQAREGKRSLHKTLRTVMEHYRVSAPLARVEVDAANISIGVLDNNGRYLGTVMLYLVFDCYTRAVLGYKLQVGKGETASSVIDAYIDAISDYPSCSSDYPMHGLFVSVFCDGGPGYTAKQTFTFLSSIDVIPTVVETGQGWKKPYVERFIGTLRSQCLSQISGYVGKYKSGDPALEVSVEKQACMTLPELKQLIDKYIVDVYHHRPHSSLDGRSPYQVWMEHFSGLHLPFVPDNFELIRSYRGEIAERTIQDHKGIQINNVFYNSRELHLLYLKLKSMSRGPVAVTCEYSSNDISEITVCDPNDNSVITVPVVISQGIEEGMSLAEYQVARKLKTPQNTHAPAPVFGHNNTFLGEIGQRHKRNLNDAKRSGKRRTFAAEDISTDVMRRKDMLAGHAAAHQDLEHSPFDSHNSEPTAPDYQRGDDIFGGGWDIDE